MTLNLKTIQQDLCSEETLVHFNNAGSSLMPKPVVNCQLDYLSLEARIGGYEAAEKAATQINNIYTSVAQLINCEPCEVALVENATIAWSSAFNSIPFNAGDKILTGESEYGSNYLAYLKLQQEKQVHVQIVPSTDTGELDLNALEDMIDASVKLISITHIPTNSGLVNPIKEIGVIAKRHNILYLVDACQTAGQLPIDVNEIHCDFLSATGRKYLRGPRGTGFLFAKKSTLQTTNPPLIDIRSATWNSINSYQLKDDATQFENWENNYAALLGLGCAIDYALAIGIENIAERNQELAKTLREKLTTIHGLTVQDIGKEKCSLVTFSIQNIEATEIKSQLRHFNINVSCSRPSSTLIDATRRELPDVVRASIHYFNSENEIDQLIDALDKITNQG